MNEPQNFTCDFRVGLQITPTPVRSSYWKGIQNVAGLRDSVPPSLPLFHVPSTIFLRELAA